MTYPTLVPDILLPVPTVRDMHLFAATTSTPDPDMPDLHMVDLNTVDLRMGDPHTDNFPRDGMWHTEQWARRCLE